MPEFRRFYGGGGRAGKEEPAPGKGSWGKFILLAALLLSLAAGATPARAAGIKPLGALAGNLLVREVNDRVLAYNTAAATLQNSLEKLNANFDMSAPAKIAATLKVTRQAQELLGEAQKTVAAVSDYVAAKRSGMPEGEGERLLPLADVSRELEAPYYRTLASFLGACRALLEFAGDNFEAISTGRQAERSRYEGLYQAYLGAIEQVNEAGVVRSRKMSALLKRHPGLRESLPQ